jgi:hypothetical protein
VSLWWCLPCSRRDHHLPRCRKRDSENEEPLEPFRTEVESLESVEILRLARALDQGPTHTALEVVESSAGQVGFAVIREGAWSNGPSRIVKNWRFVRGCEQNSRPWAETLIAITASANLIRRWP